MILRNGKLEDLVELQKLFVNTVKTVCRNDYNDEQIKVWTSGIENADRWQKIFQTQYVLVAEQENKIIGFTTLDCGNYIDLFYVHKDFQRQGIARELYTEIEIEATRKKQTELTSDVSKTARPFFERMGFDVIKEQRIVKQCVEFTIFKMTKKLTDEK